MIHITLKEHKDVLTIIENTQAKVDQVEALVQERTQAGVERILTTLGYGLEKIEQMSMVQMLSDINMQVDSLKRELLQFTNDSYTLRQQTRLR